ncbi:MAG: ribosome assembly factor SBDS [Candidatus Nanoarchaeia archaeon]
MTNGRPSFVYAKERVSFNIAHIKKGGEDFEIVLKDPDKALAFRQGKEIDPKEFLETFDVWKDAKKGEKQSAAKMKQWLGTEDPIEAAKIILRKGELHLTEEQRKRMYEAKRTKIIQYIHQNASDPRTGAPHPIQRIELAMEQARVQIDAYQPAEAQIENVIKQLRPVLPLSFEKASFTVTLPPQHAGTAYSTLKKKYTLLNEEWQNDGSVKFKMECPAGLKTEIWAFINKLTSGQAIITEEKNK